MSKHAPTIAISGMIGVGKTTLASILENELGLEPIYESVDKNPILAKFYADPKRYGFSLQMYFLNQRFGDMQHALWHGGKILDRHFGEDIVFGRQNFEAGNIDSTDFQTYTSMIENMQSSLRGLEQSAPDLTIYLSSDLNHVLKNISKRGRTYEQVDDNNELKEYYQSLIKQYDPWFENYTWTPKIKFDMTKLDLLNDDDKDYIVSQILKILDIQDIKKEDNQWDHY